MKKLACLIAAAMLFLAPCALAETTQEINPEGYSLLLIEDVFHPEEAGAEEAARCFVQGTFGDVDMSKGEADIKTIGFDPTRVVTLELAPDCEILMPDDYMNPVENVPCADLCAWFADFSAKELEMMTDAASETEPDPYTALATCELDAEGRIAKLEYYYLP